ncbi:jg3031, partial [Pararge aegeria aegeria]
DSPACNCDPVHDESVLHILIDGPKYGKERLEFEQMTIFMVEEDSLKLLIARKETQDAFLDFCSKVAIKTIN